MPIYEYRCKGCDTKFEALVRGTATPTCEACGGADLERLISTPYVKSEITRAAALRAAKQRDAKLGTERTQAQIAYERSHED